MSFEDLAENEQIDKKQSNGSSAIERGWLDNEGNDSAQGQVDKEQIARGENIVVKARSFSNEKRTKEQQEKNEEMINTLKRSRSAMLEYMSDPSYLKRLKREYPDKSDADVQKILSERMRRVNEIPMILYNSADAYEQAVRRVASSNFGSLSSNGGYVSYINDRGEPIGREIDIVTQDKTEVEIFHTAGHELDHSATLGNYEMSPKAKKIFEKAVLSDEQLTNVFSETYIGTSEDIETIKNYAKEPDELHTRLTGLRRILIDNNFAKKGQDMTPELHKKIIDLKNNNIDQFPEDIQLFFRTIKIDDYDTMQEMWDNIADASLDNFNTQVDGELVA